MYRLRYPCQRDNKIVAETMCPQEKYRQPRARGFLFLFRGQREEQSLVLAVGPARLVRLLHIAAIVARSSRFVIESITGAE